MLAHKDHYGMMCNEGKVDAIIQHVGECSVLNNIGMIYSKVAEWNCRI